MTATDIGRPVEPRRPARAPALHPTTLAGRRAVRRAVRGGLLWGLIFAGYVASQVDGYAAAYKSPAQRAALASSFTSGGLSALMGPAHDLQTVSGYTAWKSLTVLTIVGAIWGLLGSTKALRGEEDAGRWELLLAGQTTPRRATGQTLAGLLTGVLALFAVTAVATLALGQGSTMPLRTSSALFFALSVTCGAAMFVVIGALASQLAATRRQAAGFAGAVFGVSFAIRAVADSAPGWEWLRWLSPLGWVEQLAPLTRPRAVALLPILAVTVAGAVLTVRLAGRRDLDTSLLPDRDRGRARLGLLHGPVGLAVRQLRASVSAWLCGIAALTLLLSSVTDQEVKTLRHTSGASTALLRLSGHAAIAKAYLSVVFLMAALVVMFMACGQVVAARHEEASGRLERLLVGPLSRSRWLAGRLAIAVVVVVIAGLLAGACAALAVVHQNVGVGASSLVVAGLDTAPPTICLIGIGTLALGAVPRATSAVVYGLVAWSFLVELLAGIVGSKTWVLDTSLLHQMTAAPAQSANLHTAAVLVAVGVVSAAAGAVGLRRRDLAGE